MSLDKTPKKQNRKRQLGGEGMKKRPQGHGCLLVYQEPLFDSCSYGYGMTLVYLLSLAYFPSIQSNQLAYETMGTIYRYNNNKVDLT